MSLEGVFFVTLSIEAVIVSITLIVIIVFFAKLMRSLDTLNKKVLEVAEEGVEVAEQAKSYIGKIGDSAVDYFVLKLMKIVKGKK